MENSEVLHWQILTMMAGLIWRSHKIIIKPSSIRTTRIRQGSVLVWLDRKKTLRGLVPLYSCNILTVLWALYVRYKRVQGTGRNTVQLRWWGTKSSPLVLRFIGLTGPLGKLVSKKGRRITGYFTRANNKKILINS